jgi:hypothetical protein
MNLDREMDSLSLLAHKVAPNVFDLSSGQSNVSIRDQMVRAQQLMTDLKSIGDEKRSVLIVGMGVAGMTAALTAVQEKFEQVWAVDTKSMPFSLFRGVTSRFVGPYMYEWPSSFHVDQSYPGCSDTPWQKFGRPALAWRLPHPIAANQLGKRLRTHVRRWHSDTDTMPHGSLHRFMVKVDADLIKEFVKAFARNETLRAEQLARREAQAPRLPLTALGEHARPWPRNAAAPVGGITPDYVILAAGMGVENLSVSTVPTQPTPSFWSNDGLKAPGVAGQHIVILGGGDGAIQDALRAVTDYDHPVAFVQAMEQKTGFKAALDRELPALLSADRQLRQHSSWSRNAAGFAMASEACRQAARRLANDPAVVQAVRDGMRTGTGCVIHLVKGPCLDKAYLLNRFIGYLLHACAPRPGSSKMTYDLRFNKSVVSGVKTGSSGSHPRLTLTLHDSATKKSQTLENVDQLVVRFGIDPNSIPGPTLLQLDDDYPRYRTTLTRVELPFVTMQA